MHPYDVGVYPEVAAIVFTNSIAFALLAVVAFLIFREVLGSDRWGVFGLAATVCCSSYLFWSGNAKDHALVALLFAVALYCFTLYLSRENPLYLFASFVAVGWTAFARPELGPALAAGFFLFGIAVAAGKGRRETGKAILAAAGVPLGALPLLVNNWGSPATPSSSLGCGLRRGRGKALPSGSESLLSTVAGHYTPPPGDLLTGLYGAFFDPVRAGAAAFFQVSPLSFFALLLAGAAGYALLRRRPTGITSRDARLLAFFALAAALVVLAYARSLPGMSASPGIVPDMRYLSRPISPCSSSGSMP
ncbi:glycosyltransferase family 39 protein [Methanoculleus sp. 10]|uniref:glycosyltransferase family 39 protein n=1 Tax=Methanoculleus sp. 10 TaxID=430615 RepID=UPI0025F934CC|nr:glycosyltransferase family 39 protein [Methanoculleus sp. 10]